MTNERDRFVAGSAPGNGAPLGCFSLLFGAALLTGCVTASPAPTEPAEIEYFQLLGTAAHHTPRADADAELLALWSEIESLLDAGLVEPGFFDVIDDPGALARSLQGFTQRVQSLSLRLEARASLDEDERIFGALATGAVYEHFASEIRALPSPSMIAGQAELEAMFRQALGEQAGGLEQMARSAYEACAKMAKDDRAGVCAGRAEALPPLSGDRPPRHPSSRPHRAATGPRPEGCGIQTRSFHFPDPQAPPPDYAARPVVAVAAGDLPLDQATTEVLLRRAAAALGARIDLEILPREEVLRGEALVASRRWSEEGPVCGQAPPLPAVLAASHPHLVMAWLSPMWVMDAPQGGFQGDSLTGGAERAKLEVRFVRAGADEEPPGAWPLPESIMAVVEDGDDPESWLQAADSLASPEVGGGFAGVFGALGSGGGPDYVHVAEAEGSDPWLRIGRTLAGQRRDALLDCYRGPGVASFDLRWTISPKGETLAPEAKLLSSPPVYGEAEGMEAILQSSRACLAEALLATPWPCPRGGAPVEARARVCLGLAD